MDQDSGNNTDKRNWRDKLGISKGPAETELPKSAGLPKIAGEFKLGVAAPGPTRAHFAAAPKPAPMAPRTAYKPAVIAPRNSAPNAAKPVSPNQTQPNQPMPRTVTPHRVPPVAAEALAAKLKEQRDAAEKLAIQRVASAKQRADAVQLPAGVKPKFSFAEPEAAAQPKVAAVAPPPVLRPTVQPQSPAYAQQPYQPPYQPNYQPGFSGGQPSGYRPIDPATGFSQPQGFNPRPQMPQQSPQVQQPMLRPNVGLRGPASSFPATPGFPAQAFQPRGVNPNMPRTPQMPMSQSGVSQSGVSQSGMSQMPMPQLGMSQAGLSPLNAAGPRLSPAAQDDVFEEEAPRSQRRATANEYQQAYRDDMADGFEQDRPRAIGWILTALILVILAGFGGWYYLQFNKSAKLAGVGQSPPAIEAPATPAKVVADPPAATQPAEQVGKKLIYDRIEGDREVPGGPLKSSEQAPALPAGTAAPPAQNNGGAVPLPLPPPPATNGQQGAIGADGKADVALITPAAEPSSAANSSLADVAQAASDATVSDVPMPSGSETVSAAASADTAATKLSAQPATVAPIIAPKKIAAAVASAKATKILGSEPVMLVPPATSSAPVARSLVAKAVPAITAPIAATGGGLYGDDPVPPAPAKAIVVAAPPSNPAVNSGFQVQLASFASKQEASSEYQRLAGKHGAIITRYAPIIEPAEVAGVIRYRLNLGPMATTDVAQSVCATLIAAGERDCLVRR